MELLPDELLAAKILQRLPTKSIIQCTCVCKSWYSLITTPNFISNYFLNNTKTLNPKIFMHQVEEDRKFKTKKCLCLLLFDNEDHICPMSLHLPYPSSKTFIRVVGSVNGLICISINQGDVHRAVNFILFNPSVGRFLSIPPPPIPSPAGTSSTFFLTVRGLGFDETTHDYKILSIVSSDCFIYSINSNCWRRLMNIPHVLTGAYSSVFVNGKIYWLSEIVQHDQLDVNSSFRFIMVFDVKGETFGDISLPECLVHLKPDGALNIVEFGESSIAVISEESVYVSDIWVMKEYGSVESSWIKLARIDCKALSKVLGFRNKEELLVRKFENRHGNGGCIVTRNIKKSWEESKHLMNVLPEQIPCIFSGVYKYVPSLVLLDKEKNIDVAIDVTPDLKLRRSKRARKAPTLYQ